MYFHIPNMYKYIYLPQRNMLLSLMEVKVVECGVFLVNDTQTPPSPSKWADFSVQKVAQCFETNEKWIFRILVFKIWSSKILRIVYKKNFILNFAIFSFWDMPDFVLNIRSELGT